MLTPKKLALAHTLGPVVVDIAALFSLNTKFGGWNTR